MTGWLRGQRDYEVVRRLTLDSNLFTQTWRKILCWSQEWEDCSVGWKGKTGFGIGSVRPAELQGGAFRRWSNQRGLELSSAVAPREQEGRKQDRQWEGRDSAGSGKWRVVKSVYHFRLLRSYVGSEGLTTFQKRERLEVVTQKSRCDGHEGEGERYEVLVTRGTFNAFTSFRRVQFSLFWMRSRKTNIMLEALF